MDSKQVPGPTICMERDKRAVSFALERIKNGEPTTIVGMIGMGKDVIYPEILEKIQSLNLPYLLQTTHAVTHAELDNFLEKIENEEMPQIAIVNIRLGEDVSWFVERLEKIRNKYGTSFVPVIITYLKEVSRALEQNNKLLATSLYILKPVEKSDAILLLKNFEKRFGFKLSPEQIEQVWVVSQGHVGLLKSLYMLLKEHPDHSYTLPEIMKDSSVIYRIHASLNELSPDKIKLLLHSSAPSIFLEKFGYLNNGSIFSPLFQAYLQKSNVLAILAITQSLTDVELRLYNKLKNNIEHVVDRTEIAQALWEEDWEEKYSDWAIDQLIHRIREKLKKALAPYEIITKKNEGFYLKQK